MGWDDTEPRVSDLRAPRPGDEEPARRRGRRRNTKNWCRGKVGVQHAPAIRLDRYWESLRNYPVKAARQRGGWSGCRWVNWHWRKDRPWRYHCKHQRVCTECGKILTHHLEPSDCPDFSTPSLDEER